MPEITRKERRLIRSAHKERNMGHAEMFDCAAGSLALASKRFSRLAAALRADDLRQAGPALRSAMEMLDDALEILAPGEELTPHAEVG